jgi:hypothetical protein
MATLIGGAEKTGAELARTRVKSAALRRDLVTIGTPRNRKIKARRGAGPFGGSAARYFFFIFSLTQAEIRSAFDTPVRELSWALARPLAPYWLRHSSRAWSMVMAWAGAFSSGADTAASAANIIIRMAISPHL